MKTHLIIAATCVVQLLAFTASFPSVALAAPPKRAAPPNSKKRAKAATKPLAASAKSESSLTKRNRDLTRDTALQTIAVTPFQIQKSLKAEITPAQANDIAKQIAIELTAKSYLKATLVEGSGLSAQARDQLVGKLKEANLDGAVTGDLSPNGVNIFIVSKNGERLASAQIQTRLRLVKESTLKALATSIVDEIVRTIPYRGFLTR
ncbi:MAG: hypothetical protein EOP05_09935, partial [Proteobacteria bacterium]